MHCSSLSLARKILFDIGISGAGHAGLAAAISFAKSGFTVVLIDPQDRSKSSPTYQTGYDHLERTTAYLNQAVEFFDWIDVWDFLKPEACPLKHLRIVNQQTIGQAKLGSSQTTFSAREVGHNQFGFNVPLKESLLALKKAAERQAGIEWRLGYKLTDFNQRADCTELYLSNGQVVRTKLLVGADGSQSGVRRFASIPTVKKQTGQIILTFNITHEKPHANFSTEIYSSGGPFTLIPLRRLGEENRSAVVWMQTRHDAELLLRLTPDAFLKQLQHRTMEILGEVISCSAIGKKEVTIELAKKMKSGRAVLIGEAAHSIPPIGAQGFNLSVQEISTLTKLALDYREHLGCPEMVQKYEALALPRSFARCGGVGLLNLVAQSKNPASQIGRELGLTLLRRSPTLRQSVMQLGLFGATKTIFN